MHEPAVQVATLSSLTKEVRVKNGYIVVAVMDEVVTTLDPHGIEELT